MAESSPFDIELLSWQLPEPLRTFWWGRVYVVTYAQRSAILVLERGETRGTLYEYQNLGEFQADRQRVLSFGDGAAGAGVRVNNLSPTPVLSGSAARAFPPTDD